MKTVKVPILLFAVSALLIISVSAHPGRTDGNGGHHDYNNVSGLGSYHYHHGYGPHLHPNGVCPYTYAEKSGETGVESRDTIKTEFIEPGVQPVVNQGNESGPPTRNGNLIAIIAVLLFAVSVLLLLLRSEKKRSALIQETFERELKEAKTKYYIETNAARVQADIAKQRYDTSIATLEFAKMRERKEKRNFRLKRIELISKYDGKSARQLFLIPYGLELNKSNIPQIHGMDETSLIVAVAPNGKKYHRLSCNISADRVVHLTSVWRDKTPCAKCNPPCFSFEWYEEFCKTNNMLSHYGLTLVVENDIIHVIKINRPPEQKKPAK